MSRRHLLAMIGAGAGSSMMARAAASLGMVPDSTYKGPIRLEGAAKGASVVILGAGLAGLVAAFELRRAGYQVQVLEYRDRVGGRSWTLRGGDVFAELGGAVQQVGFDRDLYFNPGPWRIPHHHRGFLDYCARLGVPLEVFVQVNHDAYLHTSKAFDGKPQRFRRIQSDYRGGVAELLSKLVRAHDLDALVSKEDQERLLESLRWWGALDKDLRYTTGDLTSNRRGFEKGEGGGVDAKPIPSVPMELSEVLKLDLWWALSYGDHHDYQQPMFQPVGGMDMLARAFGRELGDVVRLNAKVVAIQQDANEVKVVYEDANGGGGRQTASAQWCLCTLPLSILGQIDKNVSPEMNRAIEAISYAGSVKIGLQFKRRFWEQDEGIYGGITYTDLQNQLIGYPSHGFGGGGKGVLLGLYVLGQGAFELTGLEPRERIERALSFGAQIHPQYRQEFETGAAVAWHRVPWALGCFAQWTDELRKEHYQQMCQIDGRLMLAGEHVSYLEGWQEGAILSSLDAISRLHRRVTAP